MPSVLFNAAVAYSVRNSSTHWVAVKYLVVGLGGIMKQCSIQAVPDRAVYALVRVDTFNRRICFCVDTSVSITAGGSCFPGRKIYYDFQGGSCF